MTERIPTHGESGWDSIIAGFLGVSLNSDGTLKAGQAVANLGYTPVNKVGDTMTGLLTIGSGDAVDYGNTTTPIRLSVKKGTAASPDTSANPLIKVERTLQVSSASFAGDGADALAGIISLVKGTSTNDGQTVGVYGHAINASVSPSSAGGDDACGIYGLGRITGSGTGTAIGGFFNGRRETNTGKANALEVSVDNETATADSYGSAGFSNTTGIWLHATGTARCAVGLAISNPFNVQLDVGIGITSQGTGGPVLSQSIRDDSASATSIQINGTHATAALAIASGAGQLLVGGTSSVFSVTNNIAEFQGSNNDVDGLVVLGTISFSKNYTMRVRNSAGQMFVGIVGTAGSFFTGTVAGDAVMGATSTGKMLHLGGTTKVVTVTRDNKLGFFAATPVAKAAAYTPTNVTTDRSYDANSTSIDELADTLGTLIADLQAYGLLA